MTTKPKTLNTEEARKVKEELSNQIAAYNEAIRNMQRAIGAGGNQITWLEVNIKKLEKARDKAISVMNSIRGE